MPPNYKNNIFKPNRKMDNITHLMQQLDMKRIPCHVAMIMDGNGRWAKARAEERTAGHFEGVNTVHNVTELSSDLGIKYLTLYAFSTENWRRPQSEVYFMMHLIGVAIERELPDLLRNNARLHLIGDIERMPAEARARLYGAADATAHCTGLQIQMCLSYSSRWELTEAVRRIAADVEAGALRAADITEQVFESRMAMAGVPDPDLLIRTGGEQRISNYLLWQIAYSELYFTPVLWPDFTKEEYLKALIDFQSRERRFGMTGEQVTTIQS